MSIDTLKIDTSPRFPGGYRPARFTDAAMALQAGHTEHLQTEHGIIAVRPFKDSDDSLNWCIDFYPKGEREPGNERQYRNDFVNRLAAIRHILTSLNDKHPVPEFEPYDCLDVWANQAEREAYVLAVIGDEVLIEYEMPGTTSQWAHHPAQPTSALRVIQCIQDKPVGSYKTMSYKAVPVRWLQAIREAGTTDWIGCGQRSKTRIPFPAE